MHIDYQAILRRLPHGNSRKAVNSLGWLVADKLFKLVMAAVIGIWVIRYLGPDRYGQWSLLLSWLFLITSVAPLGLDRVIIRDLATTPDDRQAIMGGTLVFRFLAGIVLFVAFCLTVYLAAGPKLVALACVCGGSLIIQTPYVLDYWFQSRAQQKYFIIAQGIAAVAGCLGRLLVIYCKGGLVDLAVVTLAESFITSMCLLRFYQKDFRVSLSVSWPALRVLLKQGLPLCLSAVAIAVYTRCDQAVISKSLGTNVNGIYAAAVKLSELSYILPAMLCVALYPMLSRMRSQTTERFERWKTYLFDSVTGGTIVLAAVVSFSAPLLCNLIYGPKFHGTARVLSIHIWTLPFVAQGSLRTSLLIAEGKLWLNAKSAILSALAGIGLSIWLTAVQGVVGAAAATVGIYAISAYLTTLIFGETSLWKQQTAGFLIPFTFWKYIPVRKIARLWRRRLYETVGNPKFSQPALNQLDVKLDHLMNKRSGFFVEAGGNDGYTQSNTYFLEKFRGWKGVLVEGMPALAEKCRRERTKSTVIKAALVSRDYREPTVKMNYANLMSMVDGALGSLSDTHLQHGVEACRENTYSVLVPARTLSGILSEAGVPRNFDLLSLDVEGCEVQALLGLDFQQYRPLYICIEVRESTREGIKHILEPYYTELAVLANSKTNSDVVFKAKGDREND
jgi:PST family polysaccharide transporter